MYCTNCGKELTNSEKFCPSCGKKQNDNRQYLTNTDGIKKGLYSFYISVITSPVLFIIRMLTQTTEHIGLSDGAWRSNDLIAVPGNIQAVMIAVLITSTLLNIMLRKNMPSSEKNKIKISNVMLVVNILFGIFITFTAF